MKEYPSSGGWGVPKAIKLEIVEGPAKDEYKTQGYQFIKDVLAHPDVCPGFRHGIEQYILENAKLEISAGLKAISFKGDV
ncbi:hypothetical protein CMI37_15700 [Candidatus Pacearchaeota archaeon]|nr:hypothetical protein [Candidatus Pacearchaeota archaeon]|tara:strand:+ start:1378 stop:1617 length:240 start_codon:yes stop_codon:yes gene_type:complete